jgi:hypothetical protein
MGLSLKAGSVAPAANIVLVGAVKADRFDDCLSANPTDHIFLGWRKKAKRTGAQPQTELFNRDH